MASEYQNAKMTQGMDKTITFAITNIDATTLTAIEYKAFVGETLILTKTLGSGITAPSSTSIVVAIDAADTAAVTAMLHRHQLLGTNASGKIDKLASGTLIIKPKAAV